MRTKWCPQCGAEYVAGFSKCAECGCALVDARPPAERRPSVHDNDFQFGPDDDVVELCRIPSEFQAELFGTRLREMGVPTSVIPPGAGWAYPAAVIGSRIFVRRDDAERAAALINDAYSDTPLDAPFDEIELDRLAEASAEPEGYVDPETGAAV